MARVICIKVPEPAAPFEITIPGAGTFKTVRNFALEGYNACNEARQFLQLLQPALAGLSLPLCILGCVSAVADVFDTSGFPPVNAGAIPKMIEACSCLTGFTPFGFCSFIRGIVEAVIMVLDCIIGLMTDILQMQLQLAQLSLESLSIEQELFDCLNGMNQNLIKTVVEAFGPIQELLDSTKFLFSFVGVEFDGVAGLVGDSTAEVIAGCVFIKNQLEVVQDAISAVCP